jgi:hypothetical protein
VGILNIKLFLFLNIILTIFYWIKYKNNSKLSILIYGFLGSCYSFIILAIIISIITFFYNCYYYSLKPIKYIPKQSVKLYSFQTHSNIEGNIRGTIFLTSGKIKENIYYYYYIKTKEGIKMKKIKANKAIIRFSKKPRYVIEQPKYVDYKGNPIDAPWDPSQNNKRIFYIPKGSIKKTYNANIKGGN